MYIYSYWETKDISKLQNVRNKREVSFIELQSFETAQKFWPKIKVSNVTSRFYRE